MQSNLNKLINILSLNPVTNNQYIGTNQEMGLPRVFGGQLLAQAVAAAIQTENTDRILHNCNAIFLNPVNSQEQLIYNVRKLREGKNFVHYNVEAEQNGQLAFIMTTSFQTPEDGLEHQELAVDLSIKDQLRSEADVLIDKTHWLPEVLRKAFVDNFEFEVHMQYVNNPIKGIELPAKQCVWFKTKDISPVDKLTQKTLLAYISDYHCLPTALHPHAKGFLEPGITIASLNHSMWWHRDFDLNAGLFYFLDSPITIGGRGLVRGQIVDNNGLLVATIMQEGLIRYRQP